MSDIPELEDLVGQTSMMDGRKVSIKEVFNVPLIFTGWAIRASKFQQHGEPEEGKEFGRYVILQFLMKGERCVLFTSSSAILRQIEALEEMPNKPRRFKGVIRKQNQFYKICRTENKENFE